MRTRGMWLCVFVLVFPVSASRAEEVAPRRITLEQAIQRALVSNPSLSASRETLAASGYRVGEARAGYLPQASVTAGYKRATSNSASPPYISSSAASSSAAGTSIQKIIARDSMSSYDNWNAGLTLTQTLYDFGKTGGAFDAAKASERASRADLAASVETLYLTVTQAFFTVLATQEAVSAADETKRQMEKHLDIARAQVAAGVRPKIDITRAESDLAAANLASMKAKNANQIARVTLNNAMGTEENIDYAVERPARGEALPVPDTETAVKEALSTRPDYRSLKEKIQASEGALKTARSGYFPSFGANGGLNYVGYKIPDMAYNWTVGVTLSWNAFSGLYTMNAVREAEANIRVLEATVRSMELAIRSEIESAILAYREAVERLTPSKALLQSARETLGLAEGRYSAGVGNLIEVTDAQAVYTQGQTGLIQAEYDLEVARVLLLKALGKMPITTVPTATAVGSTAK